MDDDTTDENPVAPPALPDPVPSPGCSKKSLKTARDRAHKAFDPLWTGESPRMTRSEAYLWLAQTLSLSRDEAHMGALSAEQCQTVIAAVANIDLLSELNKKPKWSLVGKRRAVKRYAKARKDHKSARRARSK